MALTVTATAGASTANSYATVAAADTYFEAHPDWEDWDRFTTSKKGRLLIQATRQIDLEAIDGDKYDTSTTSGAPDQALRFPRAVDYLDATLIIPVPVKHATYEQALHLGKAGTDRTRRNLQNAGVKSVKIGDVMETYEGGGGASSQLCDVARELLAPYLLVGAEWA